MTRVLICESKYSTTLILSGALELEGFEILVSRDSEDARFKIIMESPNFVLIDWLEFDFTRLNIKDFTGQLKSLRPDTIFVFITHQSIEIQVSSFRSLIKSLGADDYIIKPFNPTHVIKQLKNWSVKMTR